MPESGKRSGNPLPSPADLAEYETLVPGAAARLFAAFEAQSAHRRDMEAKAQAAQITQIQRGQCYGLVIGLVAIISGSLTAIFGSGLAGGFIGGGGVIGLVSVFVLGRVGKKKS
jgi:uncharacterized membrane protein